MIRVPPCVLVFSILAAVVAAEGGAPPPSEAAGPREDVVAIAAANPLIAHTLYTWYTEKSFDKASVRPLEIFRSDDMEHYRQYFSRLRANGTDVIAGIFTGRPDETSGGKALPTVYQAKNLLNVIPLVGASGMKFMIYYDTGIRTWWKSGISRGEIRSSDPRVRRQLLDDFAWIADEVVKRNQDDYLFLQRDDGAPIVDEKGLPRPVVAVYIARSIRDEPGFAALRKVMGSEMAAVFHSRGLGRPALVLDVIFWGTRPFDPDQVAAYGDNVVALTSFCPVQKRDEVKSMADWVPLFADLYARAAEAAVALVRRAALPPGLQIWPGVMPNFETRTDTRSKARDLDDWEAMLTMGLRSTRRVGRPDDPNPARSLLIIYSDEYYEGTPLLTDGGLYTLPLTVQGNVLRDNGVWLERF